MRIRSTKPEFWRSADTAALTYFTRLLFMGLWNYVDDNGVGEDDIAMIRSDLFPRDPVEEVTQLIRQGLEELSALGMITRYRVANGRRYFHVVNWHHQKINRPTKSSKPLPTSDYVVRDDDSLRIHGALTEDSSPDLGNKGTRERGIKGSRAPRARARDFTEQITGHPDRLPAVQPEAHGGAVATTAGDLVRKSLPRNKYQPATLTDLRIRVGTLLAEGNDEEVICEALRLWDERDGGPGLLPHLLADAAKNLRPSAGGRSVSAGDRKVLGYLAMKENQ